MTFDSTSFLVVFHILQIKCSSKVININLFYKYLTKVTNMCLISGYFGIFHGYFDKASNQLSTNQNWYNLGENTLCIKISQKITFL